jgi:integrase
MAREIEKLTAVGVARLKKPGYHSDGAGLYLQVSDAGTKSWIFRYKLAGRPREMGLGALHTFGLAEARQRAKEARQLLADGIDPIERRTAVQAAAADVSRAASNVLTFGQAADRYFDAHEARWKNAKSRYQWRQTINTFAKPVIGKLPIAAVDTEAVLQVLEPIWAAKTETATKLRGRIEEVLDWAKTLKYRTGDNPAAWRGNLVHLLAPPRKIRPVVNHPALPYPEIGAFMAELRALQGLSPLLLEFIILTATRTGEALGARWSEFDLEAGLWTVPAIRMKQGKEHRVPLSSAALEVLSKAMAFGGSEFVFPGRKPGTSQSNMSCLALLRRMGRNDIVVHGFRSTFRDWAAEQTSYPRDVAEMALAHAIGDKVEAAYRRGDLFEKRAALMSDWALYCNQVQQPAKVLAIRRKAAA